MNALDPWMLTAHHEAGHCLSSLAVCNRAHELRIQRTARGGVEGYFREVPPLAEKSSVEQQTRDTIECMHGLRRLLRDAGDSKLDVTWVQHKIQIELAGLITELAAGAAIGDAMGHATTDLTRAKARAEAITGGDKARRDHLLGLSAIQVADILDANAPAVEALADALSRTGHLNELEIRFIAARAGFPRISVPCGRGPALRAVLKNFPDAGCLTPLRHREHSGYLVNDAQRRHADESPPMLHRRGGYILPASKSPSRGAPW